MVKAAILGVVTVITAMFCKGIKNEYGIYVSIAGSVIIMMMAIERMTSIVGVIQRFGNYISINNSYILLLLKMLGIAFLAEFSANICKDTGYHSVASLIEVVGKLSMLLISTPVLEALLDILFVYMR